MDFSVPEVDTSLGKDRVDFLSTIRKSCVDSILRMLKNSQSGHPGGALSSLDILLTLYAFRISQTNEKIVISNGHISPAVYSVLAEMGVIDKEKVVAEFRKVGSIYEGHVTRHVPGIYYGTGPLGVGVSAAAGMALALLRQGSGGQAQKRKEILNHAVQGAGREKVFALMGDGEAEEGQVHEMALFAAKEKLNNLVLFVDYNQVQLTASLEATMPIDIASIFRAHKWNVLEIDGHDVEAIWSAVSEAEKSDMPTLVLAKTVMGKYVDFMQSDGEELKPTWHGKAPKPEQVDAVIDQFTLTSEEKEILKAFRADRNYNPPEPEFPPALTEQKIKTGTPIVYAADEMTDCRSAYGKALLDLAKHNKEIFAFTADLGGSVMTKFVASELPAQFAETGICEQNMISLAGGMSLSGFVPFASTFGAFISSRAKDQARVNDINQTNVKMVATHCGLSVGEDGPTHQAIDDMGSFLGMFNTHVIEPADPNHCDRIIRYIASHYGNFYVRMGRHKIPVLTKEDGSLLYGEDYQYEYGKTEVLRSGSTVTIVASGSVVSEALAAREMSGVEAEIVIASSIKKFDDTLAQSLRKTKKVITVEDHNAQSGLGAAVALYAAENGIHLDHYESLAVKEYQLSGKAMELYHKVGIDREGIAIVLQKLS